MKKLTKEQVLMIHSELIRETGGSDGLRDDGLLDSALNAPFQGFGDVNILPSLQQKGARLGHGLICNHAFVDGNKRIGAHIMLLFLSLNGNDARNGENPHEYRLFCPSILLLILD